MAETEAAGSFYVTGGTLPRDARSYVHRDADESLLRHLLQGDFCYILTARQMGKSSLMVRTADRLRQQGVSVGVADLTALGQNLTPDQWYLGQLRRFGRQLDLEDDVLDFWLAPEQAALSPFQRWQRALEAVLLARCPGSLVLFIDEIDTVRSLPFSTDEFFAGIRECYNRRTEDPVFARLTFCLLGVATPSDLIQDVRTTPFNIGQRIELRDFTAREAQGLVAGIVGPGRPAAVADTLLARVLHWTDGHPYLTQRLCLALSEDPAAVRADAVDAWCERLFLSQGARQRDDNLLFVRERLLRSEVDLGELLTAYRRVLTSRRPFPDEPNNPSYDILRLSGIVTRDDAGFLRLRNRIYRQVFTNAWVDASMPDAELQRQRRAHRRALARVISVATALVLIFAGITALAVTAQIRAETSRSNEEYRRFIADIGMACNAYNNGNMKQVTDIRNHYLGMNRFKNRPELKMLDVAIRQGSNLIPDSERLLGKILGLHVDGSGKRLFVFRSDGYITEYDTENKPVILNRSLAHSGRPGEINGSGSVAFSPSGDALVYCIGGRVMRCTRQEGWKERVFRSGRAVFAVAFSPDGDCLATISEAGVQLSAVSITRLSTGVTRRVVVNGANRPVLAVSPWGKEVVFSIDGRLRIWEPDSGSLFDLESKCSHVAISPGGRYFAAVIGNMDVQLWDLKRRRLDSHLPHSEVVNAVCFINEESVVTGGRGQVGYIWQLYSGRTRVHNGGVIKKTAILHGCEDQVVGIYGPLKNGAVVINSSDRSVFRFDCVMPKLKNGIDGDYHVNENLSSFYADYAPDSALISKIVSYIDGKALLYNIKSKTLSMDISGYNLIYLDGYRVVCKNADGLDRVLFDLEPVDCLPGSYIQINALSDKVAISLPGRVVVYGLFGGRWVRAQCFEGDPDPVKYPVIQFSEDGKSLVAVFADGKCVLQDLDTGKVVSWNVRFSGYVSRIAISAGGKSVAILCYDNEYIDSGNGKVHENALCIMNFGNYGRPVQIPVKNMQYFDIAFSGDGKILLAYSRSGDFSMYDAIDLIHIGDLKGVIADGSIFKVVNGKMVLFDGFNPVYSSI